MRARKVLVWVAVLTSCALLCGGCRGKRKDDVEQYKKVITMLDSRAGRLETENRQLRNDLGRARIEIGLLEKKGSTLEGLSEDLKTQLAEIARGAGRPGDLTWDGKEITLAGRVLFTPGRFEVRPEGKALLKQIAKVLADRNHVLRIDGHTDNVAIKYSRRRGIKSNRHLSAMRALSVLDVLKDNGVDPQRMFLAGFGEHWPVANNEAADGRRSNRRVGIVVLPPRAVSIPAANVEPLVKPQPGKKPLKEETH